MDMESTGEHEAEGEVSFGAPDVEVVLHAQRLLLSTERVATERVRFTKQIVTTTRTIEVPVRVEQLVVSHEPLPDGTPGAERSLAQDADDRGFVIVLHEEVPQVSLRVVPVERISVSVRTIAGEQAVSASLAAETVDVHTDTNSTASGEAPNRV